MIVLSVSSYNGAPTEPREASFDELGGTIGRATTNQLVLPDPDRTISRVHAQVVLRNGSFAVVDRGSNAISVNGAPLGNGREAPLKPGDTINIGGYVIQVRAGHQTVAKDPFGDLFGSPPPRAAAPASYAPLPPAPAFFAPPPPVAPAAAATPVGAIPADWDPFAPEMPTSGVTIGRIIATPSDPLGLGAPAQAPLSAGPSLDDLFGLGPMGAAPADPLGVLAAAPPANTAADADPLRALMQPARAPQQLLPADTVSDLQLPWQAALTPPSVSTAPATPAGAVLSWDDSMQDHKVITLPDVRHLEGDHNAPPPSRPVHAPAPAAAPVGDTAALLDALLTGLGLSTQPLQTLTPATMRLIGELLRESTRGAVELLRARAALKQEVRAQVTMIVTQDNNPLKFSPNVDAALTHLLGPAAAGFMPPARAMRDAFDDLRAHEIGVMAGMRAALDGVLARFDPQALDSAITKRGALASLLPGSRKAQLWEQFQQLYTQLSREAADDFHTLFGKAFLQAYEAQLIALDAEPGPGNPSGR
ncbi:type VI secretion system-associated FHA domain protein TagH [Roseateles saccharophilus]|uniref:FHA domain protein n=1 Tax=Roseateles saccharophilus TaxID=304 RepID=A0A4R3UVW4_ROSSA|nr:type VI secretion system-associated FHA domain protein TagH [Roseateles saccharophilus]TCU96315.1 FHA domain protein [Roseateles saccharophilus]